MLILDYRPYGHRSASQQPLSNTIVSLFILRMLELVRDRLRPAFDVFTDCLPASEDPT